MRGYSPKGRIARAAIDEAAVRRIRQLGGQGQSTRSLADTYGIAPEAIRRILRYDTWRWVSEEGPGFVQPEVDQAAIDASKEKFLKLLEKEGIAVASKPAPKPMPSIKESLAAAARESDEVAARVQTKMAAEAAQENAQLAGLLGPNELQSENPPVQTGTSTDGGRGGNSIKENS